MKFECATIINPSNHFSAYNAYEGESLPLRVVTVLLGLMMTQRHQEISEILKNLWQLCHYILP